jgi:hypothetical protein
MVLCLRGESLCVLFETLNAEEFCLEWFLVAGLPKMKTLIRRTHSWSAPRYTQAGV